MWAILIGALINLLIWFFERLWANSHPTPPTPQHRQAFIDEVNSRWRFWLIPRTKREVLAGEKFDKFTANYLADPPKDAGPDAPVLTQKEANGFATKYAQGL